ncbi:MAG: beta-ketoacyl synthase N-terminal-like domain-containing protein [Lentisphaeria bacterium]|jgi:3-oxoacyl-[acyl-carrier-protein] synthase II|nr:beta-ketoacyl synthase N-terminal-like domain-containing protein [Lentisphaeria bacterium]
MSQRYAIRGVGLAGGFGSGEAALLTALREGTGPLATVEVRRGDRTVAVPAFLADPAPLQEYVARSALRRTDRFSRLAMLGICQALAGADVDRERLGLIVGTGYGALTTTFKFLDSVIEEGDALASPMAFSNSVHSAALSNASICLGIRGPGLTVSQFELSVHTALLSACLWLAQGVVDAVVCGGVDEYHPMVGYCRDRFFGEANQGPVAPFDFARQSAVVGEGASFLLLTRDDGATPVYGYLDSVQTGWLAAETPAFAADAVCIVGADGHAQCGGLYARHVPAGLPLAAYAPVHGSFPAAPALDLAIAAIGLKHGRLPVCAGGMSPATLASTGIALAGQSISVLKIDRDERYAMARLSS